MGLCALFSMFFCTDGTAAARDPDFLLPEMKPGAGKWILRVETWGYVEPSTRKYLRCDGSLQTLRDNKPTRQWKVTSNAQLSADQTAKAYEAARILLQHFEVTNRSLYTDDDAAYEVTLSTPRASFHVSFGASEHSSDKVLREDLARLRKALDGAVPNAKAQSEPRRPEPVAKQRTLVIRKNIRRDPYQLDLRIQYTIMLYDYAASGHALLLDRRLKGNEATDVRSIVDEMLKSFDVPSLTEPPPVSDAKRSDLMIVVRQITKKRDLDTWLTLDEALHLGIKEPLNELFDIVNESLSSAGKVERLPEVE
jgi:hypothetical protein